VLALQVGVVVLLLAAAVATTLRRGVGSASDPAGGTAPSAERPAPEAAAGRVRCAYRRGG
jgi:hypothetical protein